MTATIIDGKAIGAELRRGIAARVAALGWRPGLRVVRVGEDPASGVYVRNKDRAAGEAGFDSATIHLPGTVSEAALLAEVARLNADP
ncbi:tetrahydrofolate dehydrogenase/cyclohydrolase catalytic domain-containing protein, partial [Vogesella mureinivorans]|uniref:tetrahydrofolate dehydrogenase/cyclohydrolase catalytic domain-containing protein n=1 Tax=Vogesella mureinivorans TaxID=657276 RepID=UPI0023EF5165